MLHRIDRLISDNTLIKKLSLEKSVNQCVPNQWVPGPRSVLIVRILIGIHTR